MSIAIGSLAIILLLVPGLAFYRFYYSGEFSKQYIKASVFEAILMALIPSFFFHSIGIFYLNRVHNVILEPEIFELVLNSSFKEINSKYPYINLIRIIEYSICMWALSSVVGWLTKFIVRKTHLDARYKILRYQNEWHYLLSAEILRFRNQKLKIKKRNPLKFFKPWKQKLDLVWIDALVKTENLEIIYIGVLEDYVLSKEAGLDRLYISETRRKLLQEDNTKETPIPGHFFCLDFSHVVNLNIRYVFLDNPRKFPWKSAFKYVFNLIVLFAYAYGIYLLLISPFWILNTIAIALILFLLFLLKKSFENED